MAGVSIRIESSLSVARADLPPGIEEQARAYLSIANEARAKAIEYGDWGAESMPATIDLWRTWGDRLVMPRGFGALLRAGLEGSGATVSWDDRTVAPALPLPVSVAVTSPTLRSAQGPAAESIIEHRQGVLVAATGSGKSVAALEAWRRSGTTGLIIVEKRSLARQWVAAAREHFGVEAGMIGDGTWEERPLTIAMIQTLYARRRQLDEDRFWAKWGLTCIDEAHHAVAESYQAIIKRTLSRWFFGVTATALDGSWLRKILELVLGPVIHVVDSEEGRVPVAIDVVPTDFRYVPQRRHVNLTDPRAVWRHMLDALLVDDERSRTIATRIMRDWTAHSQLVFSKRLAQLDCIQGWLVNERGLGPDCVLRLTGKEGVAERDRIFDQASRPGSVVLSTIAGEGLDIPRLDRIHLPFPMRLPLPVIQAVGRVGRAHEDKRDAVAIDYADLHEGVLRSQFYSRLHGVYVPRKMAVRGMPERDSSQVSGTRVG